MADKPVWLENSEHGIAVRALLWLERGRYNDDPCPWCRVARGSHSVTCGLNFALAKHGLGSIQQREEARETIKAFPRA